MESDLKKIPTLVPNDSYCSNKRDTTQALLRKGSERTKTTAPLRETSGQARGGVFSLFVVVVVAKMHNPERACRVSAASLGYEHDVFGAHAIREFGREAVVPNVLVLLPRPPEAARIFLVSGSHEPRALWRNRLR